jgi:hypothetical protein
MRLMMLTLCAMPFLVLSAQAQSSHDGKWQGVFAKGYPRVGGGASGCANFTGEVAIVVAGDQVTGTLRSTTGGSGKENPISGTVGADGRMSAKVGQLPLDGTFAGSKFTGTLSGDKCAFEVTLDKL